MTVDKILIIDFGSQYAQIIARRIRELGVYAEVHPYYASDDVLTAFQPKGIILSGGPESVREANSPAIPDVLFKMNIPMLGICYGMQAMANQLGGSVVAGNMRESGYAEVVVVDESPLLAGIEDRIDEEGISLLDVWMSHGDQVSSLPAGFKTIAKTDSCAIAGMADDARHWYALQFHPEVFHTYQGMRMFERFVKEICACSSDWTMNAICDDQIHRIRQQVGQEKVLLGLSGGVDSSVAALLLHEAIGDQLVCVFVDTGLLRLNEADEVESVFAKHFGVKLIRVDASKRFFNALAGVSDPEEKRKVIGRVFIEVFDEEAMKLGDVQWLAQGTIYSDVIESAASQHGVTHVIKSHHNVGGLPKEMKLKLIEPLRELFKDEVRRLGLKLGLPHELVYRHPFPGPGLGVRVLGEVKQASVDILREADAILIEELHRTNWYSQISQAFAVFLPVNSVGVVGDARQYSAVIAIRLVKTDDFMTADWVKLPYELLDSISRRIVNEVKGVSRVTYDITSKPPATIEWE